ncbi:MAG: hypothetical protein EPN91_05675 [Salinibacterium sp.]|nr:MAG: hypothetical protein EPN91_05675 [Salinibacterium sp.]
MAIPKIIGAQTDFSAGELDVTMKRADDNPTKKVGARQMLNWRILNSKAATNRPGRSALFFETGRVEEVLMSSGNFFYLVFGDRYLRVYNASGTQVFTSLVKGDGSTPIPWTIASGLGAICWTVIGLSIYITYTAGYPANVPQVLTWDGTTVGGGWTLSTYAESVSAGGQKRTPFYRISPTGITLLPSNTSGTINIIFSAAVLQTGMVGTRLSYCGRQLTIASIADSMHGTATVNEQLPGSESLPFATAPAGIFNVGDVVTGSVSGAKGVVLSVAALAISVQLIPPITTFVATDVVAGPGGTLAMNAGATGGAPGAVAVWNDEVMNAFRGYPQSVFNDQGRLGFTNVPSVPSGIIWSTIGVNNDLWVDPLVATVSTANAIFDLAPGKTQVLYVIPGMESSEFVFCDNAIYYIPITVQNPLVPGSVQFIGVSAYGSLVNVQPRRAEQTIIYVKAGGLQVGAIQAPGAYNRPYIIDNISDLHAHLFAGHTPQAIAIPTASTAFEELYIYISFTGGSLVVGKYAMKSGLIEAGEDGRPAIGWAPWTSAGSILWLSAYSSTVLLTSFYAISGATPYSLIEQFDTNSYVDSALLVNSLPAAIAAQKPIGKGPLWFIAGGTVTLLDGTPQYRMMGTYQVDANGFIIPQGNAGENLSSGALVAGQPWTSILEPFVPDAPAQGRSVSQRMFKRRVSRMAVYVSQSTGFLLARLFAGPITRTSPPLGTIMNTYRVTAWNQDDDPTQLPPLREEVQRWRPIGRAYDPRVAVIKDTPGPLIVHEIGIEASI